MDSNQYDLFPGENQSKDMEPESKDSAGLSIVPYLTVSEEIKKLEERQNDQKVWKSLTKDEQHYVKEAKCYTNRSRYIEIAEIFEKKNGYPMAWSLDTVQRLRYRERGEVSYKAIVSPNSLVIKKSMFFPPLKKSYNKRSNVTTYSMKSRKRFFEALLWMDWEDIPTDTIRELTLTYPSIYPNDGRIIKEHLHSFSKRLDRYGKKFGGIAFAWKMEFQRRGAPHFHLLVISKEPIPIEEFRTWVLKSWNNLVSKWILALDTNSKEEKLKAIELHKKAGIEADVIRKNKEAVIIYFVWYVGGANKKAKEYQHIVPDEYTNVGRWWGFYGKTTGLLRFSKHQMSLTEEEYNDLFIRIMHTWEQQGKKYKIRPERISYYKL